MVDSMFTEERDLAENQLYEYENAASCPLNGLPINLLYDKMITNFNKYFLNSFSASLYIPFVLQISVHFLVTGCAAKS